LNGTTTQLAGELRLDRLVTGNNIPAGGIDIKAGHLKFSGHIGGVYCVYPGGQWYLILNCTCCSPVGTGEVALPILGSKLL
jgi:hypothetical protein